ncbi:DinB family protein [Polaribacter batillariae]|uniref:DinB family protein n=1 Tax=Polaribacter batillariae TaxID=2808900 RepID=A0ABX7SU51_9FLAO|nr:DinB family protein [Polaribacter batillariae]QTD37706.1 DinB family protein [Polaribacter batillariae]
MIKAIEQNLQRGINLLHSLTDEQYNNTSVAPYHSSIGCHTRHILDVFSCIFNGLDTKEIDLTKRERNELAEKYTHVGIDYFNTIIKKLRSLKNTDLNKEVAVTDDLGLGNVTIKTTLASILVQAQSHTTHHYATIGYLVHHIGVQLPESGFGFNPTTPQKLNV